VRFCILAEYRTVSLAQRVVFPLAVHGSCAAFPGKNFVWCYEAVPEKKRAGPSSQSGN
jgi:hypothetical protein